MKVSIDAGGRKVEIEAADANLTPTALGDEALRLWTATSDAKATAPAFGLAMERRADRAVGLNGPGRRATTPAEAQGGS